MSNRNKSLCWEGEHTPRSAVSLAQHVDWRKWSQVRQVEYLFNQPTPAEVYSFFGPNASLSQLYEACAVNQSAEARQQAYHILVTLAQKRTELLGRPEVAKALGALVEHYAYRRRDLAEWQPKSKNVYRQLESLLRHLFDEYGDVPAWVLSAWVAGKLQDSDLNIPALAVHLGSGRSLRSFSGLPVLLTKKLEHEMRQAPDGCSVLEALRYAQLAARGALEWFGPVLESRLGRELLPDDNFWLGVVDFFTATPLVDPHHFGPVCDWIHAKRTVGVGQEPAQPNFSLKGRSMHSVLAQTERWHRGLARLRRHQNTGPALTTTWPGLPLPNFRGGDKDRIRITQLTTFGQLIDEGEALKHCVASYLHSCLRGRCGIFSLTMDGVRAITLEVTPERVVIQARGKYNRPLADDERFWVNRWQSEARLMLSKYV